jgi:hypothetical protein
MNWTFIHNFSSTSKSYFFDGIHLCHNILNQVLCKTIFLEVVYVCRPFWNVCVFSGWQKHLLTTSSLALFTYLHMHETADLLTQHAPAVRSWHLEKYSLLCFFFRHIFIKEIIHINNYFANTATGITETTTTACTWLTKLHVVVGHF